MCKVPSPNRALKCVWEKWANFPGSQDESWWPKLSPSLSSSAGRSPLRWSCQVLTDSSQFLCVCMGQSWPWHPWACLSSTCWRSGLGGLLFFGMMVSLPMAHPYPICDCKGIELDSMSSYQPRRSSDLRYWRIPTLSWAVSLLGTVCLFFTNPKQSSLIVYKYFHCSFSYERREPPD